MPISGERYKIVNQNDLQIENALVSKILLITISKCFT